jgi:hypothetical protein
MPSAIIGGDVLVIIVRRFEAAGGEDGVLFHQNCRAECYRRNPSILRKDCAFPLTDSCHVARITVVRHVERPMMRDRANTGPDTKAAHSIHWPRRYLRVQDRRCWTRSPCLGHLLIRANMSGLTHPTRLALKVSASHVNCECHLKQNIDRQYHIHQPLVSTLIEGTCCS